MTVLVDAGPLVAIYSERDAHHRQCADIVREMRDRPITCWPVVTEAAYLLRRHPAGVDQLLLDIAAGVYAIAPLNSSSCAWIAQFMRRYEDLPAQVADAALMYLAEQRGIDTIFTLDRRDFSVYRLKSGRDLKLVP